MGVALTSVDSMNLMSTRVSVAGSYEAFTLRLPDSMPRPATLKLTTFSCRTKQQASRQHAQGSTTHIATSVMKHAAASIMETTAQLLTLYHVLGKL